MIELPRIISEARFQLSRICLALLCQGILIKQSSGLRLSFVNKEPPTHPSNSFSKPTTYSTNFSNNFPLGGTPNIRRTRNDDEYYGSSSNYGNSNYPNSPNTAPVFSTRSSSSRRSGRGGQVPGYQQDTLTSIR